MNTSSIPMQTFLHPYNPELKVIGRKLGSLDVIQAGDLFSCPHRGEWVPVPASLHGKLLPDNGDEPDSGVIYVRPA